MDDLSFIPSDHSDLGFVPSKIPSPPQNTEGQATTFMQGLMTNKPTSGFTATMGREVPSMVGGAVGAAGGGVAGGIGSVPGAAIGGAAGEAARQGVASYFDPQSAGNVIKDVGIGGAKQALGEVGNIAIGSFLGSNTARQGAAQAVKAMSAVPEKFLFSESGNGLTALGEGGAKNISKGIDLFKSGAAKEAYNKFEQYTGLKGIDTLAGERAERFSSGELYGLALRAANKLKANESIEPQELYLASQAQNQIERLARAGNADAAAMRGDASLNEAGKLVDGALEKIYPEYKSLRSDMFLSKSGQRFSSIFPLNKDMSANVLRTSVPLAKAAEAATGAVIGYRESSNNPVAGAIAGGILMPLAFSPWVYGAAIRTGAALSESGVPQAAVRSGVGESAMNAITPASKTLFQRYYDKLRKSGYGNTQNP